MLLSIIIPVYNVEHYLAECLDSVIQQITPDIASEVEIICVNDGSTDGSTEILKETKRQLDIETQRLTSTQSNNLTISQSISLCVIDQSNAGLSAARNTGLREAKGDYVFFLDSDDLLADHALQTLIGYLKAEKDLDILAFSGVEFEEDTGIEHPQDILPKEYFATGLDYYNRYALSNWQFPFVCVVLRCYRRTLLIDNDLWFKVGLLHEDTLFTPLTLFKAGRILQIPDNIYRYRLRAGSITRTMGEKNIRDIVTIANLVGEQALQLPKPYQKVAKRAVCCTYQQAFAHIKEAKFATSSHNPKGDITKLTNWRTYFLTSRTKPRHRLNFILNGIRYILHI